jgi:hypothetical protein
MRQRVPVSIVCVFNDPEVLDGCLLRSVADLLPTAPQTEVITVDNCAGAFQSAAEALMHGANRARHDFISFTHQDVVLHSLVALEEAAGVMLGDPLLGVVGCSGIDSAGGMHGRIRDRAVLTGRRAERPVPVDSVDEVQFMVRAADLLAQPLSNDPDLAWHAYAVEYGLRLAAMGRLVAAMDLPLTHNSLTVNLARLDDAHAAVGARYPDRLPVRTTCGVIRAPEKAQGPLARRLQPHRWRYRWLRESLMAHRGLRRVGPAVSVLADIRLHFDDVLGDAADVTIVNVDDGWFGSNRQSDITVHRRNRIARLEAATFGEVCQRVQSRGPDESFLVTNLTLPQLAGFDLAPSDPPLILGYHLETGYWLLLGPAALRPGPDWLAPRAVPAWGSLAASVARSAE